MVSVPLNFEGYVQSPFGLCHGVTTSPLKPAGEVDDFLTGKNSVGPTAAMTKC